MTGAHTRNKTQVGGGARQFVTWWLHATAGLVEWHTVPPAACKPKPNKQSGLLLQAYSPQLLRSQLTALKRLVAVSSTRA